MRTTTTSKDQKPQRGASQSRPDVKGAETMKTQNAGTVHNIPLAKIKANPQVRTKFNGLLELGADIKKRGLLQPIVVRPEGDGFTVVVGGRRFKAMQLAGCTEAPAIIANVSDADMLETQLIENIQRENLNSKDLVEGVRELYEKHGEVKKVAAILSKSQGWVSKNLAIALSMGPLTVRLLAANVKDKTLLYEFAKLEKLDTAAALELVELIEAKHAGRKEVMEALKNAVSPIEEKSQVKDDSTGDLFEDKETPCPAPVSAAEEALAFLKSIYEKQIFRAEDWETVAEIVSHAK